MNGDKLPRAQKGRAAMRQHTCHPWFRKQHVSWDSKDRKNWALWKRRQCGNRMTHTQRSTWQCKSRKVLGPVQRGWQRPKLRWLSGWRGTTGDRLERGGQWKALPSQNYWFFSCCPFPDLSPYLFSKLFQVSMGQWTLNKDLIGKQICSWFSLRITMGTVNKQSLQLRSGWTNEAISGAKSRSLANYRNINYKQLFFFFDMKYFCRHSEDSLNAKRKGLHLGNHHYDIWITMYDVKVKTRLCQT